MAERFLILIAEDNPGDVYLVREAFREHSVQADVHSVEDGEKAISFLEEASCAAVPRCPDLMLLDLNLPRRNGHEVLEFARAIPLMKDTPIVLLTSSESPKDRVIAQELGVTEFFLKPTGLDEFLELGALVKSLLSR